MNVVARLDRYNHDIGEDTDDTEDNIVFGSFSSFSPQYKKVQSRLSKSNEDSGASLSSCKKNVLGCDSDTSGFNSSNLSIGNFDLFLKVAYHL